jgi:hypothetical protein
VVREGKGRLGRVWDTESEGVRGKEEVRSKRRGIG